MRPMLPEKNFQRSFLKEEDGRTENPNGIRIAPKVSRYLHSRLFTMSQSYVTCFQRSIEKKLDPHQ
jgi:hypothetical protein